MKWGGYHGACTLIGVGSQFHYKQCCQFPTGGTTPKIKQKKVNSNEEAKVVVEMKLRTNLAED